MEERIIEWVTKSEIQKGTFANNYRLITCLLAILQKKSTTHSKAEEF